MIRRALSLHGHAAVVLACVVLLTAGIRGGTGAALAVAPLLLFLLACILLPRALGLPGVGSMAVNKTSPGPVLVFVAWVLLLLLAAHVVL